MALTRNAVGGDTLQVWGLEMELLCIIFWPRGQRPSWPVSNWLNKIGPRIFSLLPMYPSIDYLWGLWHQWPHLPLFSANQELNTKFALHWRPDRFAAGNKATPAQPEGRGEWLFNGRLHNMLLPLAERSNCLFVYRYLCRQQTQRLSSTGDIWGLQKILPTACCSKKLQDVS